MGLISDIQTALIAAMAGDLSEFMTSVTFQYLQSDGTYDPVVDDTDDTYISVGPFDVPCVRPSEEEQDQIGVEVSDWKIIVPGNWLPSAMESSDRVIIAGEYWNLYKVKSVPGDPVYIFYVRRT